MEGVGSGRDMDDVAGLRSSTWQPPSTSPARPAPGRQENGGKGQDGSIKLMVGTSVLPSSVLPLPALFP